MLHLIFNIIKNLFHTEEKPYDKSVHAGEEPYICDFIIVSLNNKPGSQKYPPIQTYWLKLTSLSQRRLGFKGIANLILTSSLFILFCKTDADFHQKATFVL